MEKHENAVTVEMYDTENGGPMDWAQDATRELLEESRAPRVHEGAVTRRIVAETPLRWGDAKRAIQRCVEDGFLVAHGKGMAARYLTLPELARGGV